jgi:tetratricopeptide (TPR) repeat protein
VGAVATQSFANTSFGWRGLDLLESGATPDEALIILLRDDDDPFRRQVGIVSADGLSKTYTGKDCLPWAGGRCGRNYAVQGNILTGEAVVVEMEKAFLNTVGSLGERLYAALMAGDSQGGDSRGRQSAALLVVRKEGGYGGFSDRAIDIRVDDHPEPFQELGRLLHIALMNDAWNHGWTLFTQQKPVEALVQMERAAKLAPDYAEVLYDLAVIRLAAGERTEALQALEKALQLNPRLKSQAGSDSDLADLAGDERFEKMVK